MIENVDTGVEKEIIFFVGVIGIIGLILTAIYQNMLIFGASTTALGILGGYVGANKLNTTTELPTTGVFIPTANTDTTENKDAEETETEEVKGC